MNKHEHVKHPKRMQLLWLWWRWAHRQTVKSENLKFSAIHYVQFGKDNKSNKLQGTCT